MTRMNLEIMRGFGVTRRRGTESGGILLGKIDRRASKPLIHIQDFAVVPCEYAAGPSYILSETDQQRFKEALARSQPSLNQESYAVGYFRSHTREGFAPDDKDAAIFREFFQDPLDVALLIKPFATKPAVAGFFLSENGVLQTGETFEEFSFEAPAVSQQPEAPEPAPVPPSATPSRPARAEAPAPAPIRETKPLREPVVERELFASQSEPASSSTRNLLWCAFFVALLAFGAACGYEYAGHVFQQRQSSAERAVIGGLPNVGLYSINLQAVKMGNSVMVKWDRDAAPIQAALNGALTVSEGANSKEVKLSFAELRNGTVMYPLKAPEIRFRLEVFFKDNRSFAETAMFLGTAAQ
jgi:hypothetical protein